MKKRNSFTLAEVLITLTIIGVIAALTIPNLMQKWQDRHVISAVKKAYSIFDNALKTMYAQEGPAEDWDWPGGVENNTNYFLDKISSYLKISKKCYSALGCTQTIVSCNGVMHYPQQYAWFKTLDGSCSGTKGFRYADMKGMAILNNGMMIAFYIDNPRYANNPNAGYSQEHTAHRHIGHIRFDINGSKGPNQAGYDIFYFAFDDKGIKISKPINQYDDEYINPRACNIDTSKATIAINGYSCATWIMRHGNMDYKYRDVSAEW